MQVKPFSEASADHVRVTVKEFVRKLTRRWEQLMKLGFIIRTLLVIFLFLTVKTEELGPGKAWSWVRKGPECLGMVQANAHFADLRNDLTVFKTGHFRDILDTCEAETTIIISFIVEKYPIGTRQLHDLF
jgi:hypothetical protein